MTEQPERSGERILLRIGGVAAIVGTILQVAAGTSQTAQLGAGADLALESLAAQPDWMWPVIYFGFIFGAVLWVGALVALAATLTESAPWALGRLAVAAAIIGATLHAVDGSLNAGGLAGLARTWEATTEGDREGLVQSAELLLQILDATWVGVITLFHGVPFVLAGLAVALGPRYPAWLGWVGFVGGAGSVVIGIAMFLGLASSGPAVIFAVILSVFMVILGWLLWVRSADVADAASPSG
jgi:hypothetical protein